MGGGGRGGGGGKPVLVMGGGGGGKPVLAQSKPGMLGKISLQYTYMVQVIHAILWTLR